MTGSYEQIFNLFYTITGIGICIVETPQIIILSQYFEKKLAIANGIRVIGNPLGGMLYPLLLNILFLNYGLKLSFLLQAAVQSHLFICIAMIRPFNAHKRIINSDYKKYIKINQIQVERTNLQSLMTNQDDDLENKTKNKKTPLDFTFLRRPSYLIFLIMTMLAAMSVPCYLYFIPAYGRSVGLTPLQYTLLVSIQSILDAAFRPIIGYISDLKCTNTIYLLSSW